MKHLKENGKNEVDFLLADKNQKFVQIDTAILDVCGQECPQYRNILIKKVCDEVDFLYADKHESYLQIDGLISAGDGQTFPKFPKQQVFNVLTIIQKEVRDEVDFLLADKHQSFLQVDFNTLSIKFFYNLILSLLMGILKVLKVTIAFQ